MTPRRLGDEAGAVLVEFALLMAALTPAIILGTDLLVRMVEREADYVTCAAALVPGDPWPTVCDRFLADGITPPDTVPGLPLPAPDPTPTPTPEATQP